jgi:hypothetical protein
MQNNVFISAPISVDWSTVQRFESELKQRGKIKVRYWERWSQYNQNDLDSSDAVVFILPNNKFKATYNELPIGLKSEVARAYALNKRIYIGYETSTGSFNIYNANTDGKYIDGISGTANDIYGELQALRSANKIAVNSRYGSMHYNPCSEIELPKAQRVYATTIPNPDYVDQRILLMM